MLRSVVLSTMLVVSTAIAASAEEPAEAATRSLDEFLAAWNNADNAAVRETLNYPHLSLFDDLVVAHEPKDFHVDFLYMRAREYWLHSTFGEYTVVYESPSQVHIETTWERVTRAGETYRRGRILYVITNQDNHWGMQLRVSLGEDEPTTDEEHDVLATVNQFFDAWNGEDNDGVHATVRFPHAFLIRDGRVALATGPGELITDFARMRENEGWDKSSYDSAKLYSVNENNALLYLTFYRHHADGSKYRTVPVLWILGRDVDRWGLQLRVIMEGL